MGGDGLLTLTTTSPPKHDPIKIKGMDRVCSLFSAILALRYTKEKGIYVCSHF